MDNTLVNFIEKIQAHKISEMWKTWMRILKDFHSIVHFDDVVYYMIVVLTFLWPYLIKTIRKKKVGPKYQLAGKTSHGQKNSFKYLTVPRRAFWRVFFPIALHCELWPEF